MKKLTIHFSKVQITLMPACNGHFSGNGTGKLAKLDIRTDPRETTCGNCKRTTAWKKSSSSAPLGPKIVPPPPLDSVAR